MRLQRSLQVLAGMVLVGAMLWRVGGLRGAEEENRPAELKVLDRWVGEWDMDATIKPNEFMPQGSKSTFKTAIRWSVNGRFLRCDAEGTGAQGERKFKDAFMWIASYDPRAKAYTSTVFWANVGGGADEWGGGLPGAGQWDEKTQTLTIKTVDAAIGLTSISVTKWIDADTHEWASTMTDGAGKVIMEMSGKAKRRK